jgi:hypothetical protein
VRGKHSFEASVSVKFTRCCICSQMTSTVEDRGPLALPGPLHRAFTSARWCALCSPSCQHARQCCCTTMLVLLDTGGTALQWQSHEFVLIAGRV